MLVRLQAITSRNIDTIAQEMGYKSGADLSGQIGLDIDTLCEMHIDDPNQTALRDPLQDGKNWSKRKVTFLAIVHGRAYPQKINALVHSVTGAVYITDKQLEKLF